MNLGGIVMDNYSDQAQLEFSRRLAQFVEAYGGRIAAVKGTSNSAFSFF